MVSRRDFVQSALVGTIGVGLARPTAEGPATSSALNSRPSRRKAPMRILILGGTGFIGPHQVRSALERGHSVTLFNRGRTNPGLFPNVETLIGDRDGGLDVLRLRPTTTRWSSRTSISTSNWSKRLTRILAMTAAKP